MARYHSDDARGAQVNFTYDILGRVTERKARMSVNDSWASVATYTYDSTASGNKGIGRLTSSTSPAASDTITYDLLGRVTSTTRTIDSVNYTTSMTYDSLGRVLTTTLPTSEVVTSTYNARGLFESMSGTDTYVTSTAYTPTGGIDQQLLGNSVTTTFEYDSPTNRLKKITASKIPANPLINLTYTYDTGGNITQINDDHDPVTANREVRTYGYDFLNRLTSADVTVSGSPIDERDYAYNPIGNMTSFTLNNGTATTYTYPTSGSSSVQPHAVSSRDIPNTSNDDSFTYDANGNMTSRVQNGVTWTQTFDAENRLVSVTDGTTTTQYVYDGSGGRVKRIVGNTTTLYVAGMEIEKVSGTETQRTVYYPAGGAFRVIVASPASNTLYFRHSDHLGSTSVLSDATGAKVTGSDVVYAPFGVVRSGAESALTDFGYTGQIHDDDTGGLMFYGARYYLPGVMRFISADTIIPGMNPQALNRYSYVLNSPINMIDPSGHVYMPVTDYLSGEEELWEQTENSDYWDPGTATTGLQSQTVQDYTPPQVAGPDIPADDGLDPVYESSSPAQPEPRKCNIRNPCGKGRPCNAKTACGPSPTPDELAVFSLGYISSLGTIYRYQSLDFVFHPYSGDFQLYGSTHSPFTPLSPLVEKAFMDQMLIPPYMLGESGGISLGALQGESIKEQKTSAYQGAFTHVTYGGGPIGVLGIDATRGQDSTGEYTDVKGGAVTIGVGTPVSQGAFVTDSQPINNIGDFLNFLNPFH